VITRALQIAATSFILAFAEGTDSGSAGLQNNVAFTDYSSWSSTTELARRLMTPLAALRVREESTSSGKPLPEQRVSLTNETFALYVPPRASPQGYALLVFVPPWETATVPKHWASALDRHHMIFVTAAKSGNSADVLNRREPLALLAAQNIMRRYPVDPQQVYVGGFSGGSRVALRIALGFADVFHGALLNASSDPIGNAEIPLPPRQLLREFQASTRVVYVTGAHDAFNIAADVLSRKSLEEWCVFDLVSEAAPWAAHEVLDSAVFNRALDALIEHARPDAKKLAACRARIDENLASELQHVKDLLASGKREQARRLLRAIDAQYGGLAAPDSIELARSIE
jgi:pimeloyl-ACP methyl ester carboxylesterase